MMDEAAYTLTSDPGAGNGSLGCDARLVVCPGCDSRYLVAAEAFKAVEGRRVRCAGCGHSWQYSPQPSAIQPSFLDEVTTAKAAAGWQAATSPADNLVRPEPLVAADALFPEPAALARRPVVSTPQQFIGRRGAHIAILGAGALAAAVVLLALLAHEPIAARYPSTAALYARLGLGKLTPDIPGAGLRVTVIPLRSGDGLVIKGNIVNAADIPRRVPRLRLTLVDGKQSDIDTKVINPPVAQLAPGATAQFNTVFEHPAVAAVRVNVSFATD